MSNFKWLFSCLFVAASISGTSQILITKPGDTVMQKSAMLEVKSNERGFLPPRMSSQERRAIVSPAAGLMVYDTDRNALFLYTGTVWRPLQMGYDSIEFTIPASPLISDLSANDYLGLSVDVFGNYAVAGAPYDDVNGKVNQGSVYFFKKDENGWQQQQKILAVNGLSGDQFGVSVSINDSFVVVGAPTRDVGENFDQGVAYVYKIEADTLRLIQQITGAEATAGDLLGYAVKLFGNNLLVGAPFDDIGANSDQGASYVFKLNQGQWIQHQKLFRSNASGARSGDLFGSAFLMDSASLFIGCEGTGNNTPTQNAVIIYKLQSGLWEFDTVIAQPDDVYGQRADAFGYATALVGNQLIVGAWLKNEPESNKDRGALYQFSKVNESWSYDKKIVPMDPNLGDTYGDYFGYKMASNGNYLLVTAHYEDLAQNQIDYGSVFIYERQGSEYVLIKKVISPNPTYLEFFGSSVSSHNKTIMIGAMGKNGNAGAVYFININD